MGGLNLNRAEFVKSAAGAEDFIRDGLPQVVFAGKSNVGKSSVINRLLGRKALAYVGSEPGKTVHVNYFRVDGRAYFVDLPGYGYAAVPDAERRRWSVLMERFFAEPERLALGVFLLDARHAPTADDRVMADWFRRAGVPFAVCANKADKLRASERETAPGLLREALSLPPETPVVLFSAEKGTGREALLGEILRAL